MSSIIKQTYDNLEIILVDDGSPDNSPALCDEFAQKDPRIKVIHKINGGLSSARNAGIKIATGKYVIFVDSDDYILPFHIENLHKAISSIDAQLAACNQIYEENGKRTPAVKMRHKTIECAPNASPRQQEKAQQQIYNFIRKVNHKSNSIISSLLRRIFVLKIIRDNGLYFPTDVKIGEDRVFIYRYLPFVTSYVGICDATYIHQDSDTSVCKAGIAKKDIPTQLRIVEYLVGMYKEGKSRVWGRECLRVAFSYRDAFTRHAPVGQVSEYQCLFRRHLPFMLRRLLGFRAKFDAILFATSVNLFCKVHSFFKK